MADCLTMLRRYNTQKKEIVEREKLIIFDQMAWPRNAKTNYLIYRTGQGVGPREYYTLESLLFLLKNVNLSHPMYVQRAGAQNIPVIKFPDRRGLLSYLNGETETSASIDKSIHLEMGAPAPVSKRPNEESHSEGVKKPRLAEDVLADKQRLKEKLEGRGRGGALTDQLRSLSEAMSIEQIAAIKAKRLAKKRATIKTDDDMTGGDRTFLDDTTRQIMSKERSHRSRVTALQSSGKIFTNIFSILQTVKARDEGKGEAPVIQQESQLTRKPAPPTHGYNRYGQERFTNEDTGDFKIDTSGTYHGMTLKSMTESVTKSAPTNHKALTDKTQQIPPKPSRKDHRSRTPILVVPAISTTIINMINTKDFLESFRYVSLEDKKLSGTKKVNDMIIHRKKPHPSIPGQTVSIPYRVTDQPLKLSPDEWKQVVGVFVAGPMWQFKGWPGLTGDGSPVEIFTRIKAFHVKFDELKMDKNIQKWDIHILPISNSKRHLDKASVLKFWETLDRFIVKHNPELRY
ncbi:parafibromin-like [Halichondria panicea]|uniref:parafibromin-like n=1 Tax=Halichondria panicea TaxID=6063 RepID=UPI00312BC7C9